MCSIARAGNSFVNVDVSQNRDHGVLVYSRFLQTSHQTYTQEAPDVTVSINSNTIHDNGPFDPSNPNLPDEPVGDGILLWFTTGTLNANSLISKNRVGVTIGPSSPAPSWMNQRQLHGLEVRGSARDLQGNYPGSVRDITLGGVIANNWFYGEQQGSPYSAGGLPGSGVFVMVDGQGLTAPAVATNTLRILQNTSVRHRTDGMSFDRSMATDAGMVVQGNLVVANALDTTALEYRNIEMNMTAPAGSAPPTPLIDYNYGGFTFDMLTNPSLRRGCNSSVDDAEIFVMFGPSFVNIGSGQDLHLAGGMANLAVDFVLNLQAQGQIVTDIDSEGRFNPIKSPLPACGGASLASDAGADEVQ